MERRWRSSRPLGPSLAPPILADLGALVWLSPPPGPAFAVNAIDTVGDGLGDATHRGIGKESNATDLNPGVREDSPPGPALHSHANAVGRQDSCDLVEVDGTT